ncbi:hypothetical protein EYF80_019056 [Liparis tanakae]|uniref:Uncharacterized protein n=1 Tax=Liparis tanakae TaxID=230148 RepID=A0A4Z2I0L5_9TELE|nr:hypothetical protein EYF80_019056 [Liparis tanakae]
MAFEQFATSRVPVGVACTELGVPALSALGEDFGDRRLAGSFVMAVDSCLLPALLGFQPAGLEAVGGLGAEDWWRRGMVLSLESSLEMTCWYYQNILGCARGQEVNRLQQLYSRLTLTDRLQTQRATVSSSKALKKHSMHDLHSTTGHG